MMGLPRPCSLQGWWPCLLDLVDFWIPSVWLAVRGSRCRFSQRVSLWGFALSHGLCGLSLSFGWAGAVLGQQALTPVYDRQTKFAPGHCWFSQVGFQVTEPSASWCLFLLVGDGGLLRSCW